MSQSNSEIQVFTVVFVMESTRGNSIKSRKWLLQLIFNILGAVNNVALGVSVWDGNGKLIRKAVDGQPSPEAEQVMAAEFRPEDEETEEVIV